MKTMTLGLLMALMAAPMFAGEKEEANTRKFLDGATSVRESALGKEDLHLVILGASVGKMQLEFTKGEVDGKPAYLLSAKAAFEFGVKRDVSVVAAFAPNLALISQEESESEDGKVVKTQKWTVKDGAYSVELTDSKAKTDELKKRTLTVKPQHNLLAGAAGMLLGRVLPVEAASYAFKTWDSDSGEIYDATVTVSLEKDGTVVVKQAGMEAELDDEGNVATNPKVTTAWIKGGKFVKVDMGERFVLTAEAPAKRTEITEEMLTKREKEFAPVALFFKAANLRSTEKMSDAVNVDRFLDIAFDQDEEAKNMTPEQRAEAKALYGPMILQQLMGPESDKSEAEKKGDAAFVKLLLHVENFIVTKGEDGKVKVTLTEEVKNLTKLNLTFVVELIEKKWQIVWIDNGGSDPSDGDEG